jgi:hypothetical protein
MLLVTVCQQKKHPSAKECLLIKGVIMTKAYNQSDNSDSKDRLFFST